MARDIFFWSKWSPHVGNAITIATGIPVLSAAIAGVWAYLAPSNGLAVALVTLASFMMALWCCIGFLWLRDRSKQASYSQHLSLDAQYGLLVDTITMTRDAKNPTAEWLVKVVFRNILEFPIKMVVIEERLIIENRAPDIMIEEYKYPIIIHRQTITKNLPLYSKGLLPDKDTLTGMLYFRAKYGHPDGDFTRLATRYYNITMRKPKQLLGVLQDSFVVPFDVRV